MIDSDEDDEAHLGDDFDLFGSMRRSQVSQPLAGDGAGNDDNGGGANGDALEEVEDEISEPPFGADRKAFWVRRLVRMDNDRGLAALQWLGRWLGRAYHERQGRQRVAIFDGDYGVFNIVPENDEDRAMLKIPYLQVCVRACLCVCVCARFALAMFVCECFVCEYFCLFYY